MRFPLWLAAGLAVLGMIGCSGLDSESNAQTAARGAGAGQPPAVPPLQPVVPPDLPPPTTPAGYAAHDASYPFYMPMQGLRRPANRFFVKCDASQEAGREVYQGNDVSSLYGRAEGGMEFVYEARDRAGRPCVYPFAPSLPDIVGNLDGTQYIFRSSVPGERVTFRSGDQWAVLGMRALEMGRARIHFEMRDIELDFPGAIQPMGALHLETFGGTPPGLFTAVVRRSKIFGGKNAIFVPGGETMLYVEDSEITGNVGTNADQEHGSYINGTLVSHFRNSRWQGQQGWSNIASGHQLKDKAYLRIYENVTASNAPGRGPPSAMPLIDASSFGFTWSNNLRIERVPSPQEPRDALVDLRSEILYGAPQHYPWPVIATSAWSMPPAPLAVLDKVYLSVFFNTSVLSYRKEPYVFALRPWGRGFQPGTPTILGEGLTTRSEQRAVSLAFDTHGTFGKVYSADGWTYADPSLPQQMLWVADRDAFIRHALGLIGR
ncbi:hypothetical protein AQZ52_01440 [Novosphingobium fuchskuhlense]|uniref:Uncharacterized protein n=1 Tax=Novosphingobium fuchskuhlense TaxID=1117702 RepID=A0A117UZD2_9SPHN|nr:hypothetical protein [Novosphingobium fuchskuhlense]KUR73659.1 hypothetical protein AQZ52_01440 [Novosphingobium fuchskuhlense]